MEGLLLGLVIVTVVVFAALETWLIVTNRPTISTMIRNAYKGYPPLGFLVGLIVGLLLGHFFWQ